MEWVLNCNTVNQGQQIDGSLWFCLGPLNNGLGLKRGGSGLSIKNGLITKEEQKGSGLNIKCRSNVREAQWALKSIFEASKPLYIIEKGNSEKKVLEVCRTLFFIIFACSQTPQNKSHTWASAAFVLGFYGFFLFPGKYEVSSLLLIPLSSALIIALQLPDLIIFYALAIIFFCPFSTYI